jgi:hypothetical protein
VVSWYILVERAKLHARAFPGPGLGSVALGASVICLAQITSTFETWRQRPLPRRFCQMRRNHLALRGHARDCRKDHRSFVSSKIVLCYVPANGWIFTIDASRSAFQYERSAILVSLDRLILSIRADSGKEAV